MQWSGTAWQLSNNVAPGAGEVLTWDTVLNAGNGGWKAAAIGGGDITDVVAGAGIGILSAKAGYWLYPTISRLFTNKQKSKYKTAFIPFYNGKTAGFGLVSTF